MVIAKEGLQGGPPGQLCRFEGGPAAQKVTENTGIFILKPLQHLREIVLQGTGEAVRDPHFISDHTAPVFDELCECAHGRTLWLERLQLVAMGKEEFELEFSIRGVIFGPAGRKGFTIPRQRQGIDREEDEEVVLAQGGDQRPFVKFKADSKRLAMEPCAQRGDPRVNGLGRVLELKALPFGGARSLEAPIMFGISPVDPDKSRKGVV